MLQIAATSGGQGHTGPYFKIMNIIKKEIIPYFSWKEISFEKCRKYIDDNFFICLYKYKSNDEFYQVSFAGYDKDNYYELFKMINPKFIIPHDNIDYCKKYIDNFLAKVDNLKSFL